MVEVDARGLSCPLPIMRVKDALDQHASEEIVVLVDQQEQLENVTRLIANNQRIISGVSEIDGEFRITIKSA
jgi:tRNA 2-thiouridine synthesizing protein A